jgi:TRAP-type uncharacterized transport system fused permease subunit
VGLWFLFRSSSHSIKASRCTDRRTTSWLLLLALAAVGLRFETALIFTLAALYAMAAAIEGHMEAGLNWLMRAVMAALCVVLIWPVTAGWHWVALAVFAAILIWNVLRDRRGARAGSGHPA